MSIGAPKSRFVYRIQICTHRNNENTHNIHKLAQYEYKQLNVLAHGAVIIPSPAAAAADIIYLILFFSFLFIRRVFRLSNNKEKKKKKRNTVNMLSLS